jgi:dTDP-4-dehydrorhamnose reductase
MARILVIGAKGMLGTDLVDTLRASSRDDVIPWDIDEIDIRIEKETVGKIARLSPEVVINCAAWTNVDDCEARSESASLINAEGMRHVALGARECRAKVVYLSTDYVFDGRKSSPYAETDLPNPLSVYGRSKLQGERYVQDLVENALIVRTQWLYGRHGRNFVSAILGQARQSKSLSIVNDQTGSPTYTIDLAKAIAALVGRNCRGIFHVANSGYATWFEFGWMIVKCSGIPDVSIKAISSQELGRVAVRPSYSGFDCSKLKDATGIAMRPWSEALEEFLRER